MLLRFSLCELQSNHCCKLPGFRSTVTFTGCGHHMLTTCYTHVLYLKETLTNLFTMLVRKFNILRNVVYQIQCPYMAIVHLSPILWVPLYVGVCNQLQLFALAL